MKHKDKIDSAYTVILPTYAPVGIFVTYRIAVRFCELSYGSDWKGKSIRIEKTKKEHIKLIAGL